MKNLFLSLIVLLVLFSTVSFGKYIPLEKRSITNESIENYLEGLKSDNLGLKTSSAYFLGEYCCEKSVIPLLQVLKSDSREEARIAAALALYKIDDARGLFAVKQAVKFDDSERVKRICSLLYKAYTHPVEEYTDTLATK